MPLSCISCVGHQEVTGSNKHHTLQRLNKLHKAKRKFIGKKPGVFVSVKARECNPNNAVNLPASDRPNI